MIGCQGAWFGSGKLTLEDFQLTQYYSFSLNLCILHFLGSAAHFPTVRSVVGGDKLEFEFEFEFEFEGKRRCQTGQTGAATE